MTARRDGQGRSGTVKDGPGHRTSSTVFARLWPSFTVLALVAFPASAQQSHVVIISGLSGGPEYAERFDKWAGEMIDAVEHRFGVPPTSIFHLSERPTAGRAHLIARATREEVERVFSDLAGRAAPDDVILVLLLGHGSAQGGEPRFNLPGPDLTARDVGRLLGKFPTQRLALVNAASASGDFIGEVSGKNRVIVTATRSGAEKNETVFGGYFVQAFAADGADVDKDGRVSLLEAFEFARRETARHYETEHRIQTEHALLDDNGDAQGSREPEPVAGDGSLARRFVLVGGSADRRIVSADSTLTPLYADRRRTEEQIAVLRNMKATMDSTAYENELERLLLQLAEKNREIRQMEKKP